MRRLTLIAALAGACAPTTPPPACPRCYEIDEVAPYEPPRRVVILCDEPDASSPEPDYPPPDSGDPFSRVF